MFTQIDLFPMGANLDVWAVILSEEVIYIYVYIYICIYRYNNVQQADKL